MGQRFAGIANLKINGDPIALRGNFTVSPSAVERTGVAGQDYVHGFQELPRVPYIEGDVSLRQEVSVEALLTVVDETITADLANGKTYVLRNGWTRGAFELNTRDGLTRVRFEGEECDEI